MLPIPPFSSTSPRDSQIENTGTKTNFRGLCHHKNIETTHTKCKKKKIDIDKDDVFVLDTKPTEYNVNYNDIIPLSIILWCIQPYFVYLIYFRPLFLLLLLNVSL